MARDFRTDDTHIHGALTTIRGMYHVHVGIHPHSPGINWSMKYTPGQIDTTINAAKISGTRIRRLSVNTTLVPLAPSTPRATR